MIRSVLPLRSSSLIALALTAGLSWVPGSAAAQSASTNRATESSSSGDTIRLTDDEREAVLDRNTVESAAAARGEMTGPDRVKLEVHGEVSAFVGSNGSRGIAGTAAVPLGDNAQAVVSFESERVGYRG